MREKWLIKYEPNVTRKIHLVDNFGGKPNGRRGGGSPPVRD